MYSDKWMFDKTLHKTSAERMNSSTNLQYWVNKRGKVVGVCVNYELARDVHYELLADQWNQFLLKVLKVRFPRFGGRKIRAFFETKGCFEFEAALDAENIKYQKIAFYS